MMVSLLLIVHFLCDFYLQNDTKVEMKNSQKFLTRNFYKTELFQHTMLYVILSSLIFTIYRSDFLLDYLIVIGLFFSHGVVDMIKIQLSKKCENRRILLFFLDQIIHIAILCYVSIFILNRFTLLEDMEPNKEYLLYLLVILLLGKTANVIFGVLFENFKPDNNGTDDGFKNAGGLIGVMERYLVFVFLITGNIGSIGFIIAAKSVARFKKLSETQFGEYFLLGTLFSVLFTMLTYYVFFVWWEI